MTPDTQPQNKSPSIPSALRKLHRILEHEGKRNLVYMGIFALIVSILEIATASTIVLFGQILNNPETGYAWMESAGLTKHLPTENILVFSALLCGAVYLVKNSVAAAEVFFQNFSIQNMSYTFKNRLLKRYAYADYADYLTRNSAYNSRVVGSDAEIVFSGAVVALSILLSESVIFAALIALIIYINPSLAVTIFCTGSITALLLSKYVLPLFYRWGKKAQHASLMSWQTLLQFFHAFKEIALLGKRESFISYYQEHSRNHARLAALQASAKALPRIIIEVLFVGLFVTAICFLSYSGQPLADMLGTLGAYLYAGFRLMPGLNRIITQLNIFKSAIPALERVYEEYTTVAAPENYADIPNFAFNDKIDIQNVSFQYKNCETPALHDINLTIRKGEKIGIVGETGSGKSTLVDIILGLLKPQRGSVLIDERFTASAKQWHNHIGYVPQTLYLTDNTIEANIAFGVKQEEIDQNRLNQAVQAAQLQPLLKKLPDGLQTVVGERGIRLSGGERQRVAIARALYRTPEVLIFDEATSALDNETESRLMKTIENVSKNHTVIMIAHRLSTLESCDRIITLKDGTLASVEPGAKTRKQQAS